MARTTGYFRPGEAGGYADPYPTSGRRTRRGFLSSAGSARARLMEEQLKRAELERKMLMEEFMNSRRRKIESPNILSSTRGTEAAARGERQKRSMMMRDALLGSAGPRAGGHDPFYKENLYKMINAISPEGAHEGLMQSGRVLASLSQTGGGRRAGAGRAAGGPTPRPAPVSPYSSLVGEGYNPGLGAPTYGSNVRTPYGGPLPPMERGTLPGTVPRTGQTEVHKGEVVIPRRQVDSDLMHYLVADATRKRVPLGRKNSKGYQVGSLGESDEEFLSGWERALTDKDQEFLRQWMKDVEKDKPKAPEKKKAPPAYELPEDISALTKLDVRADRGLTWPQSIGRGAKVVGGVVGDVAGTVGESAIELGRGLIEGYTGEPYGAASPEAIREAESVNAANLQAGNEARAAALALQPSPAAPTERDPTGFKLAQARVRKGDFGTPDKPLELIGQLSEREEAYREVSGRPQQREAKNKADMARAKVTNLLTTLQFQGGKMDPEVKKNMMEQVKFHQLVATGWDKEIRGREKAVEEELKESEKSIQAYNKSMALERERQTGRLTRDEAREERTSRLIDQRFVGNNLRDAYQGYSDAKTQAQRNRNLNKLANYISQAVEKSSGGKKLMSEEEAVEAAVNFVGMSPGEMEEAIFALSQ